MERARERERSRGRGWKEGEMKVISGLKEADFTVKT